MDPLTVVFPCFNSSSFELIKRQLPDIPDAFDIIAISRGRVQALPGVTRLIEASALTGGMLWNRLIRECRTRYLLLIQEPAEIVWGPGALMHLMDVAETTKAGIVYADYWDQQAGVRRERPVNDYQLGSIRDDFHFGPVLLISVDAARSALDRYGPAPDLAHAGLYDLRLKIATDHELFHLREYLYTKIGHGADPLPAPEAAGEMSRPDVKEQHFIYVDPRQQLVQREMEGVAAEHLKRLGAWLKPAFKDVPPCLSPFPVEASVIIPVRDRKATVADAVKSALSQETDFPFNVVVVDNHSTDGTTTVLSDMAQAFPSLEHLIPVRTDLGIGGCWNEAVFAGCCGRYAVQLDSDDLYRDVHTLQKIIDVFERENCAAVIGAYTLVNEALEEIPPGLVDHREWTEANGRNNALRINGLGAPRAFRTDLLRQIGFLNVSYGEDYAMVLRLLREYRLARIYESLYLCRRWKDNTDAGLPVEKINRNDAFKDQIRTLEIMARRSLVT